MSLDRLLGTWTLTMRHAEFPEPVTGRQRYERVLDGAFVILHWTYDHPDFPDAIAMLGESTFHYFDVRRVVRVFDFAVDDEGWSMVRIDEDFSQRTVGRFRGADTIDCVGERSGDSGATWQHDFTMELGRIE
jgi:hypothetical protein